MIWLREAAILGLAVTLAAGAKAQDAPAPSTPAPSTAATAAPAAPPVPAQAAPAEQPRPQANNLPNPPTPPAAPAPGSFVPGRTGAQSLTSALRGQAVYDPKNEKIGEVSDFVLDPDGRVSAVVLAVGGVLGLGAKDVAVPFGDLKTGNRDGKPIFVLDHTPEEVRNAPAFAAGGQPKT